MGLTQNTTETALTDQTVNGSDRAEAIDAAVKQSLELIEVAAIERATRRARMMNTKLEMMYPLPAEFLMEAGR